MKYYQGRTEQGHCVRVGVRDARIETVEPIAGRDDLPWLLPVLVDTQNNGGLGTAYNQLHQADPRWLARQARQLRRHGVGRCLVTLTTYPRADLVATAAVLGGLLDRDSDLATLFCGIFHEGLFISPEEGWRGAHRFEWVEPPDYDHIRRVDAASGGRVRVVNVAPEQPGGPAFIDAAVADGKIVALGHCAPDAATVHDAVRRGARLVTHFGNGAPPMIHRHRNPFWAFLSCSELKLGLICDGFHLPPDLVRAALAVKGLEGCFAVSDTSGHAGCPPGRYTGFGGRKFVIEPAGYLHLEGQEILSGAWFNLDRGVEFLVREVGLSLPQAWALCSRQPAALAGIELPQPVAGAEASFVLARWREGLELEQCLHLGREYLDRPVRPTDPAPSPEEAADD